MAPTRTLCPVCFQSFDPRTGAEGGTCPSCQEIARTRSITPGRKPGARSTRVEEAPEPPAGPWYVRLREDARSWCNGRLWWARAPLWIYFAYVLGRHLVDPMPYRSIFDSLNLGIHELGHYVFRPFGEYLSVAGGTITQLAAPLASGVMFFRQRDYFGITVAFCWLATNLWGVAVYSGDARALDLHLVSPGMGLMPSGEAGGIIHDWNYLLGPPGLLRHDQVISGLFSSAAVACMGVGLALGAWLMFRMALTKPRIHPDG